jgi:hypothetical protein
MINTVTKNISVVTGELCSYQVTQVGTNRVLSVPLDPANTDYQEILEWAKIDGNTIEDAD